MIKSARKEKKWKSLNEMFGANSGNDKLFFEELAKVNFDKRRER